MSAGDKPNGVNLPREEMKLKLCRRFLPHLIASTYLLLRWTLEREKAPQCNRLCLEPGFRLGPEAYNPT